MILLYIDESGTSEVPGNTTHFILVGLSIPIEKWKICERDIQVVKSNYEIPDSEIHTGWMLRPYLEQSRIPKFDSLDNVKRRNEVRKIRTQELYRLQKSSTTKTQYHQTKKNYRQTNDYIHLTLTERRAFITEIASVIGSWGFARLFAECIDKIHFSPQKAILTIDEQAFEQVVSRFEHYLQIVNAGKEKNYGLIIHDNNPTIAKKHTELMRKFHLKGTFWTRIKCIIETPLFVDSQLTSMIQLSDVCAYALRRYLENKEEPLFNEVFKRADRKDNIVVGVRHFTEDNCSCKICAAHKLSRIKP